MSTKRIVFQNDNGGIAIIVPSAEAEAKYGIDAIAKKDVPAGKPYKIVDAADIPSDRTFRDAWEISLGLLTDGVGSTSDQFAE